MFKYLKQQTWRCSDRKFLKNSKQGAERWYLSWKDQIEVWRYANLKTCCGCFPNHFCAALGECLMRMKWVPWNRMKLGNETAWNRMKLGNETTWNRMKLGNETTWNRMKLGNETTWNRMKLGNETTWNRMKLGNETTWNRMKLGNETTWNTWNRSDILRDSQFNSQIDWKLALIKYMRQNCAFKYSQCFIAKENRHNS